MWYWNCISSQSSTDVATVMGIFGNALLVVSASFDMLASLWVT